MEAGRQAGFELTDDYNGAKQEGFGAMEQTIHLGRRWSAANAYLRPALRRKNVSLVSGFARRVIIENQRATGVEIEARKKIQVVKARREVVIAASAVNSPKLLMLSGIGPAEELKRNGIDIIADRPGVGRNLQDHLELYIQQESLQPITLYSVFNPFSKALIGAEWLLFKTGLGATNHFEAAAFVRSAPGVDYPDIQYHFIPAAVRYDGKAAAKSHGFQAHVGPMRSKSRGTVTLRSPDPHAKPEIRFNYMSHPDDWRDFRHCIRLTREIFGQAAFDPYRGREISPGSRVQSDDELDDFIRLHAESAYHPCGTCKMGSMSDPLSVVDPECRVIGVEGLRVADSSIFPRVTNGNLNGPSIMTGEKAADHILGRTPLPPSNQEPWINPRWRESDR
jgi:choline dehydrogenase